MVWKNFGIKNIFLSHGNFRVIYKKGTVKPNSISEEVTKQPKVNDKLGFVFFHFIKHIFLDLQFKKVKSDSVTPN